MPILLRANNIRVLVNPGDLEPLHVHVIDGELEVKIDISGDEASVLEKGRKHQNTTTAKHTREAIGLVSGQLAILESRSGEVLCLTRR